MSSEDKKAWHVADDTITAMVDELKMEDYRLQMLQEKSRSRLQSRSESRKQQKASVEKGRPQTSPAGARRPQSRQMSAPVAKRAGSRGRKGRPPMRTLQNNETNSAARLTLVRGNNELEFLDVQGMQTAGRQETEIPSRPQTAPLGVDPNDPQLGGKHRRVARPQSRGRADLVPPEDHPKTRPGMSVTEFKKMIRLQRAQAANKENGFQEKNKGWGRPKTAPPKNLEHLNQTPRQMTDAKGRSYQFQRNTIHWSKLQDGGVQFLAPDGWQPSDERLRDRICVRMKVGSSGDEFQLYLPADLRVGPPHDTPEWNGVSPNATRKQWVEAYTFKQFVDERFNGSVLELSRLCDSDGSQIHYRDSFLADIKSLGYGYNLDQLWKELDEDQDGVITIIDLANINSLPQKDDMLGTALAKKAPPPGPPFLPPKDEPKSKKQEEELFPEAGEENDLKKEIEGEESEDIQIDYVAGKSALNPLPEDSPGDLGPWTDPTEPPVEPGLTFKEILCRLTDVAPKDQVLIYHRSGTRLLRLSLDEHTLRSYGICHGDVINMETRTHYDHNKPPIHACTMAPVWRRYGKKKEFNVNRNLHRLRELNSSFSDIKVMAGWSWQEMPHHFSSHGNSLAGRQERRDTMVATRPSNYLTDDDGRGDIMKKIRDKFDVPVHLRKGHVFVRGI